MANHSPDSLDRKDTQREANRDPLSGRAGAHPVGAGVGAAAGGIAAGVATGAIIGSAGGPIGMPVGAAIGAAVGAIAGGLAGKAVAESVNPTLEHAHRPGTPPEPDIPFDDYGPAYGWESQDPDNASAPPDNPDPALRQTRNKHDAASPGPFTQDPSDQDAAHSQDPSQLAWEKARQAARDSFDLLARTHDNADNVR